MASDDLGFVLGFILFSLAIGVFGFKIFTGKGWYDSLCLASLSLGNNYNPQVGSDGLLFVSLYCLYGTIIFYVIATVVVDSVFRDTRNKDRPVPPMRPRNPALFNDPPPALDN